MYNPIIEHLKFIPEKTFDDHFFISKNKCCHKCNSNDGHLKQLDSSSWTAKYLCTKCGYYNYIVFQDMMGGAMNDFIAIDKKNVDI